jgi:secreted PhoX family phosphatase
MSQPKSKLSRRNLFAGAATVGAAAAAVTLLPPIAPDVPAQAGTALKPPPERGGGYQLTERVKQYYKSTLV